MSLWTLNQPPNWYANPNRTPAIATPAGWADPITGELLVAIVGLSNIKEPNGAPSLVRVTFDKLSYKHGDVAYVIAQFSEPVAVIGTPQVVITASGISGSPLTLSYSKGASAAATATYGLSGDPTGQEITVVVGTPGTGYFVPPIVTLTGGGIGSGASYTSAYATILNGSVTNVYVTGASGFTGNPSVVFTDAPTAFVRFKYTVGASDVVTPGGVTIGSPLSLNSGTISGTTNTALTGTITGTIPVGSTVVGETSGATGVVKYVDTMNGIIYVYDVVEGPGPTPFSSSETVTVSGSGATAGTPTLISGQITFIPVSAGGSLYSVPPTVNISDSTGSGAVAYAIITPLVVEGPPDSASPTPGVVTGVVIKNTGVNYTSPVVTFTVQGSSALSAVAAPAAPLAFSADSSVALTIVDAVLPAVSTVTVPSGSYNTGSIIPVTVTFSKPVTVTGTGTDTGTNVVPTLVLSFSDSSTTGTAVCQLEPGSQFAGGTGFATTLVFNYQVQAADQANEGDMTIAGPIVLPSGVTITDHVGNHSGLTFSATFSYVGVNDVGLISNVVLSPNTNGSLDFQTGDTMNFTVIFDQPVVVVGSPYLSFDCSSTTPQAVYTSGSGSSNLVFSYTPVGSSDKAGLGVLVTDSSGITLNGGTIKDVAGTSVDLSFSAVAFPTATVNSAYVVSLTGVPTAGNYTTGTVMTLTANFNEDVTVASAVPYIAVTIGIHTRDFAYTTGSGTSALNFAYTLISGDLATAGGFVIGSTITLNSATIKNGATNNAVLSFTPGSTANVVVNDAPATVSSVIVTPGNYNTGDTLTMVATFSKNVLVTGVPTLQITTTGGTYTVSYVNPFMPGTTPTPTATLSFNYKVQTTDTVGAVSSASTSFGLPSTASITDAYGVNITNSFSAPGTFSDVVTNDTQAYFSTPVLSSTGIGTFPTLAVGDVLVLTFAASETLTVSGTPEVAVTFGTHVRQATYASGSGSSTLLFHYTTVSGDVASPGQVTMANIINLNSGTILDSNNGPAVLGFVVPDISTISVINDAGASIATPAIAPANYTTGMTIPVTVTFGVPVFVTGTPTVAITTTGGSRVVNYSSGSGSSVLTFNYLVVSGDTIGAVSSAATSLGLSGATIKDQYAVTADNSFSAASTFAHVATNDVLATLGTPVGTSTGVGTYPALDSGDVLILTFTASKAVTVTGTPYATVTTAGGVRHVAYNSGTGSTTLVFHYTTVVGDDGIATTVSNSSPIVLNGGTMDDALGIPITLTYTPANLSGVSIT